MKKRKKKPQKFFSFAFLTAIPVMFFLGGVSLIALIHGLASFVPQKIVWALFLLGFIAALCLFGTSSLRRLRTWMHELKHALVVIFSGNKIKDFHADVATGHVEFEMTKDKVHFAPIIGLAPYFLPLFSFPVLIICLVLGADYKEYCAIALGFALSIDISTAYTELHPHQTDLKEVPGGSFFALLFISAFHFMWTLFCLLWIVSGNIGFINFGLVIYQLGLRLNEALLS